MATTIYDIAKEVGTSAATVSMALQGSSRISETTKKRVYGTAERLGYQPNRLARALVKGKTKTIGFVFNFSSSALVHDLASVELFHSISQVISTYDYKTFFHSSIKPMPVKDVLNEVASFGVDGVVLASSIDETDDRQALYESQIPVVVLRRNIFAKKVSCVTVNDTDGVRQAIDHLRSLGHRRIAFAGKHSNPSSVKRFESYHDAMTVTGEYDNRLVFESTFDADAGKLVAGRIVEMTGRPTAVYAGSDALAIGIITGLKDAGIMVPDDISVVGNDNVAFSKLFSPALTTIDRICDEYARTVVDALMRLIEKNEYGESITTAVKLIVRQSTSPVRG